MSQQIITLLPMISMLGLNAAIFGTIAVKMAKKRGLRTVPAFFAGMFRQMVRCNLDGKDAWRAYRRACSVYSYNRNPGLIRARGVV